MGVLTKNEMNFILKIFKNPKKEYNARNIAIVLDLSHTGALKIAKNLEKDEILISKRMGNAIIYQLDKNSEYVKNYTAFLLQKESRDVKPYVKRWVTELKQVVNADIIILFGSVLTKGEKSNDIDVLFLTDNKRIKLLEKEIKELNQVNIKKIHPLYQSEADFKDNLKKEDSALISALSGLVIKGEYKLWGLLN